MYLNERLCRRKMEQDKWQLVESLLSIQFEVVKGVAF